MSNFTTEEIKKQLQEKNEQEGITDNNYKEELNKSILSFIKDFSEFCSHQNQN